MKISFLVTYYNQKEYVRQSLDSILRIEKPCDWEILVGDDGSSDDTTEVVKEYMQKHPEHIFLYVMDREQGKRYEIVRRSSANRLNLVDHMTGDFFCFLDGDDCYCDTTFVVKALEQYRKDPSLAAVVFGHQTFSDTHGVLSKETLREGLWETGEYLRSHYIHAGACVLKNYMTAERRAFLHNIGYYDDNNILINNLNYGSMYAVDMVIYSYRQTATSTFNAMDDTEQAVLNTQGYDVDRLLLSGQDAALLTRYGRYLLQTYFSRRKLKNILGEQKHGLYLQGCKTIPDSVTYALLNIEHKNKAQEQRIQNAVFACVRQHPKRAAKMFLNHLRHSVRKQKETT